MTRAIIASVVFNIVLWSGLFVILSKTPKVRHALNEITMSKLPPPQRQLQKPPPPPPPTKKKPASVAKKAKLSAPKAVAKRATPNPNQPHLMTSGGNGPGSGPAVNGNGTGRAGQLPGSGTPGVTQPPTKPPITTGTPGPTKPPVKPSPPEPKPTVEPTGPTFDAALLSGKTPEIADDLLQSVANSTVKTRVFIKADGTTTVQLIKSCGSKEVDQAVLDAMKAWEWKPAQKLGRPVDSEQLYDFQLSVK